MSRSLLGAVVLLIAFVFAGCDTATPASPTTTEVPTLSESYSGTLTVNGAVTHPFVVGTPGGVTATLVAVSPDAEVPIGMSIGTFNTTTETCTAVISNDLALQGRVIVGNAQTSGAFCVRVYDVGRLTQSADYQVQVIHQ